MNRKKVIFSLIFLLFNLISLSIYFQIKKVNIVTLNNKVVIKGNGKGLYKYYIPIIKNETIKNAINKLLIDNYEYKKIYVLKNRKWVEVQKNKKVQKDSIFKII